MESTVILESYLLSKSGLENMLSFEEFQKEAPGHISDTTLQLLYDKLVLQRQSNVLSRVKNNIERDFDIPVHPESYKKDLMRIEKYLLGDLVSRLEEMHLQLDANISVLDENIFTIIDSIRTNIGNLKSLGYENWSNSSSNSSEGIHHLIRQAMQTIDDCEDHIISNGV